MRQFLFAGKFLLVIVLFVYIALPLSNALHHVRARRNVNVKLRALNQELKQVIGEVNKNGKREQIVRYP